MDANSVEEKIRRRAYQLYLSRGQIAGRDREDWLEAEREVLVGERPLDRIDSVAVDGLGSADVPLVERVRSPRPHDKRRPHA